MVACLDATKGDISRLLLGQGLYMAGDAVTLRCMSTSGGDTSDGMSESGEDRELCLLPNHWCYIAILVRHSAVTGVVCQTTVLVTLASYRRTQAGIQSAGGGTAIHHTKPYDRCSARIDGEPKPRVLGNKVCRSLCAGCTDTCVNAGIDPCI